MSIQLPDVQDFIEANPQVDLAKVKEALDLLAELRKYGVRPATYKLGSPWQGRRLRPADRPSLKKLKLTR